MKAVRGALLIDLENMLGQRARPNILIPRLDALISHAGPGLRVVAACASTRITAQGKQILSDRDVHLLVVDGAKDAADTALLEEAHRLRKAGYARFVVASADGTFGQLADVSDLEIMLWEGQEPRKNAYTDRASKVHRLAKPGNATTPKAGRKTPKTPAAAGTTAHIPTPAPSGKIRPAPPLPTRSTHDVTREDPAPSRPAPARGLLLRRGSREVGPILLRGAAIFAAGTLFGAGSVVGASAARHLLRPFQR